MDKHVKEGRKGRRSPLQAIANNPVAIKELRSRMRGRRAFVVLTIYLIGMSGFISLVYLAYASSASGPFGPDPRQAGKVVFTAVLAMQVILVTFIGPSFTAGAISGEKERQTYDLLRTTLLTANAYVMGKLVSALSYVVLLIVASIPLQSIAFMLGGVAPVELFLSQLLVLAAAVTFALYGLFASSAMRSTLAASVTTFAGTLFVTIGLPTLVGIFAGFFGPLVFGTSPTSWLSEAMLAYAGLFLSAANLPATLVLSEIFLLQEDTLFLFKSSFGSHSVWLFSPWPLFLLFYLLLALILYWACVRRVRRIADK
jgi:ABC-type transport system involved in multi-copper enzyme maturation permease subunit